MSEERRHDVVTKEFCNVKHQRIEQVVIPAIQRIETKVNNMDIAIRGNGTPGLKAQSADHEKRIKEIENRRQEAGFNLKFIFGLAVMIVISAPVAAFLVSLVNSGMAK